jgi:hypothetical protein
MNCRKIKTLLMMMPALGIWGCSDTSFPITDKTTAQPVLLFQSGFENDCRIVPKGNYDDIIGKDNSFAEKNDWVDYLEQVVTNDRTLINYTGGDSTMRFAKIIPEPGNPKNNVLWFWLNDSWTASENENKGRVQLDFNGLRRPCKELYQSVRVYLHNDLNTLKKYPEQIDWLTIAEFWNNEWWLRGEKYGFRITLGIGKAATDTCLHFILNAEDAGPREVWNADNDRIQVPIGKWFTMEYYFKEGGYRDGRFYMAITPEGGHRTVVFDVTGYTHCTYDPDPDGLTSYNPMKLYTSKEVISFMKSQGKTLQIYWDDLKLWKSRRP